MAATKAKKPVILNNLSEENIVTKSRPLMLMKEVPFELGELKVLDTYLSRINPMDPEATTVRFSKEEYEDLMGIERMRPERLSKYVDSIMGKRVTVPDPDKPGQWRKYNLFDYSECLKDENEQWWIDLSCTPKAKRLFFNVSGIGYIRYQLKNVLPLKSKYSVLLYVYLLDNRFRKSWNISVDKLRTEVFRCNLEYYQNFKYFKRDLLDKSIKEINNLTDLTFAYKTEKSGRNVTHIKFYLIKDETADLKALEEEYHLLDEEELDEKIVSNALYADVLPEHFTIDEVIALRDIALDHVPYEPLHPLPKECRAADYLRHKVNLMKVQKKPVRKEGMFNWLRKAAEEDW